MSEKYEKIKKVNFEPSTIENIDRSIYDFVKNLHLSVKTNEGSRKVPILWGTSERSFLGKDSNDVRDKQGLLKLPLITIRRSGITKSLGSKGAFQGNVLENPDEQGGSLVVSRVINQNKTKNFANADAKKLRKQENFPRKNKKIVYTTVSAPMPVNVEVDYEITIRTEYQQQMNNLILPFVTIPGTINFIRLKSGEHKYEGFIQGQFQSQGNLVNYTSEERKFEMKIQVKVIGYLVGQGNNREKPHFSIRENAVEVKLPKERVMIDPEELEKYNL